MPAHAGNFRHSIERLDRLAELGYAVRPLDISEFLKAEAALTCKSLLFAPERSPCPRGIAR